MTTAPARTNATLGNGTGTQAINRTFAVLELFRDLGRELGISEIAAALGLSASTVHRIVRALVDRGYLAQNTSTERYYLGRASVLLGQAANLGLGLDRAQSVLEHLREETGESVNLGVREGGEMIVLMHRESPQPLRFSQEPGSRLPVYATSMGKVTLAHGESIAAEIDGLEKPLRPLTSNTIVSVEKLTKELETIRRQGFSVDNEEALPGVRCIAAPILSASGLPVGAVAIQGPSVRMSRVRLKSLAPLVRSAAEELARMMPTAHHL
jgi:IclR family acetate operon transcriptional repressor